MDEFDFDRTSILRSLGFETRNLGSMQMSTDTAAICTKKIVVDLKRFSEIPFVDRPEFVINDTERIVMNFRYLVDDEGRPLMSPMVLKLITSTDFDYDLME